MAAVMLQGGRALESLRALALTLRQTSQRAPHIATKDFVQCCDTILPFFDHLGPVFHVARGEFQQKADSIKALQQQFPVLQDIVAADRRCNRATVKNSPTRNLHRLCAAILFIKLLFEKLLQDQLADAAAAAGKAAGAAADAAATAGGSAQCSSGSCSSGSGGGGGGGTLREAAAFAYEGSLAPFHTVIVRGVVRAGMLTLPGREHFMAAIGESEESAAARAHEVIAACNAVYSSVTRLFDGIAMPASNVWLWPGKA